jgi:hypothetical protein
MVVSTIVSTGSSDAPEAQRRYETTGKPECSGGNGERDEDKSDQMHSRAVKGLEQKTTAPEGKSRVNEEMTLGQSRSSWPAQPSPWT